MQLLMITILLYSMKREPILAIIQGMKHGVTFNMMKNIIFMLPLMYTHYTIKIKDGLWHMTELLSIKIQMEFKMYKTHTVSPMTVNTAMDKNVITQQE
jgi:hypothetical protein